MTTDQDAAAADPHPSPGVHCWHPTFLYIGERVQQDETCCWCPTTRRVDSPEPLQTAHGKYMPRSFGMARAGGLSSGPAVAIAYGGGGGSNGPHIVATNGSGGRGGFGRESWGVCPEVSPGVVEHLFASDKRFCACGAAEIVLGQALTDPADTR